MYAAHETSLSTLPDHKWYALQAQWAHGATHNIRKIGRRWALPDALGRFPLFATKAEAFKVGQELISAEALWRSLRRAA